MQQEMPKHTLIPRIKKNYEFNYVYKKGVSCACKEMVLLAAPNRLGEAYVGYSVSKKIGNSVTRNHAKRWMKEAVKMQYCNLQKGYHYIVAARDGMNHCNFKQVCQSFGYLLKRVQMQFKK